MKAKVYQVSIDGLNYLVEAQTSAGATRDVIAHLSGSMRERAVVDLATGEQLYRAGRENTPILNSGKYANVDDPDQLPLAGIPETANEEES